MLTFINVLKVGGSFGHVSKAIARLYPNLHFIVQDLPDTIEGANSDLPTDLVGQVTFQGHDFFTPQVTAADAYFFRYILHNWAEDDAVRIIQNLEPKLKKGSRLLINEYVSNADAATASMEDKIYRYV
jgi:chemotaxis methyl-accepting protein methylase